MPLFLPFYFVNMLSYSFLLLLIVILFPLIYTELCYVADYPKEFPCFVESFIPLIRVTGNPKQKLDLNFVTGLTNAAKTSKPATNIIENDFFIRFFK